MELITTIYTVIFITFETILLVIFVSHSLDGKIEFTKTFFICFLVFLQLFHRFVFYEIGMLSIVLSLSIDILAIGFCFEGKLHKKIFLICIFYAFSIICDASAALITTFCFESFCAAEVTVNSLVCPASIVSKIMLLYLVIMLKDSLKSSNNLSDWLKYLPAPLLTILMIMWGSPFSRDMNNFEI